MKIISKTIEQSKKSKRNPKRNPQSPKQDYRLLFKALDHSLAKGVYSVKWQKVGL